MSDLLDDLVKASREAPVHHDEADETRRRILAVASHASRTTSSRRLAPWVLPLVAALVATGALAAGPLGVTQALFGPAPTVPAESTRPAKQPPATVVVPAVSPPAEPAATPSEAVVPTASATVAAPTLTGPTVVPPTPQAVLTPPSTPRGAPVDAPAPRREDPPAVARAEAPPPIVAAAPPEPPPTTPVVPPAPPPDPADDLYRAAHDAHFRGGNPSAAIEAWDRYLVAAPRGRFAVEARYNRALALLKAGRRAEGLVALEPFANGAFGNYRRDEAQRLLGAARDAGAD